MLQPDRLAPTLDPAFIVPLARPSKAGLEQIMRRQRSKPLGEHALRPSDLADGRRQIVVRHPLGHPAEIGKGAHMGIQEGELIAAVIEPHEVIAGIHEVHQQFPGVPLLALLVDHHIKKIHLRQLSRSITEGDKHFGAL
jgi:hypothetical protein